MSLWQVYEFERKLLDACRLMTERGLRVDDALRRERIAALADRAAPLEAEAAELVKALPQERLTKRELFYKTKTCKVCHNGKKKRLTCMVCNGYGKREEFEFNFDSPQQLADVLYKALKLPVRTRDNKITTDEEALQSLVALDKSGLVAKALRFRKLSTMREIYERLAPAPDGRVRSVFNPAGTLTGRLSSRGAFYVEASTNLQNLPAFESGRDPLYEVRGVITPTTGHVFLYADLSQAEARVTAGLSRDEELLALWQEPHWDIHRWTAAHIFTKQPNEVTKTERYLGKVARHALNYGMGPARFWRHVNASSDLTGIAVTQADAKRIHEAYHGLHPRLKVWWAEVETKLRAEQPITTVFGRSCNFWPRLDSEAVDSDTLQSAIAYEPQGTIADLLNIGLLAVVAAEDNSFRVVHQIHDAILVEARSGLVRSVAAKIKRLLERPLTIRGYELTIPAEIFVGPKNWAELERVL